MPIAGAGGAGGGSRAESHPVISGEEDGQLASTRAASGLVEAGQECGDLAWSETAEVFGTNRPLCPSEVLPSLVLRVFSLVSFVLCLVSRVSSFGVSCLMCLSCVPCLFFRMPCGVPAGARQVVSMHACAGVPSSNVSAPCPCLRRRRMLYCTDSIMLFYGICARTARQVLHHMISRMVCRMTTLMHKIAVAKQHKTENSSDGTAEAQGESAGKDGARVSGGGMGEGKTLVGASKLDLRDGVGGKKKAGEEQNPLKAEEAELKNLRHSLIQIVSGVCPNFEGMYTCPLSPHLPALILPLLQALEDRDQDLCKQAKRCAELSANTPMLSASVLPQVLGSVYLLGEFKSWHVRSAVLLFLQIIAFRHQFLMGNDEELVHIRDLMLSLLQVSRFGVRLDGQG